MYPSKIYFGPTYHNRICANVPLKDYRIRYLALKPEDPPKKTSDIHRRTEATNQYSLRFLVQGLGISRKAADLERLSPPPQTSLELGGLT